MFSKIYEPERVRVMREKEFVGQHVCFRVCARERERDRERKRGRERERWITV